MSKQFLAVLTVIVLFFVGIYVVSTKKDSKTASDSSANASSHVEGAGSKNVTLVEYGDFQCPYCIQYYPTLKEVAEIYKDDIKFQFRNFPLTSLHQNAFAAARAAEAASLQGKYWEMHDALYSNADPGGKAGWVAASSPTSYFNQFATQVGLDATKFKQDFASTKVNDTVNADVTAGTKLGITGTPSFFLNGKQIQVANTTEAFKKVIDAEIAKSTKQ